jgi:hypothetical protein
MFARTTYPESDTETPPIDTVSNSDFLFLPATFSDTAANMQAARNSAAATHNFGVRLGRGAPVRWPHTGHLPAPLRAAENCVLQKVHIAFIFPFLF